MKEMRAWKWTKTSSRRVFTAAVHHACMYCTRTYRYIHPCIHILHRPFNQVGTKYLRNATHLFIVSELYIQMTENTSEEMQMWGPDHAGYGVLTVLTVLDQFWTMFKEEIMRRTWIKSSSRLTSGGFNVPYCRFPRTGHDRAERRHRLCRGKWKRTILISTSKDDGRGWTTSITSAVNMMRCPTVLYWRVPISAHVSFRIVQGEWIWKNHVMLSCTYLLKKYIYNASLMHTQEKHALALKLSTVMYLLLL